MSIDALRVSHPAVGRATKHAVWAVLMIMLFVGGQQTHAAKVLYLRTHSEALVAEDSVQALGYKALFDSLGHPTTIVRTDGISGLSLAQYDVIAIGDATGGGLGWAGDSATIATLKKSGKAVLALGNGGPVFLEKLGLWASWGQSAGTNSDGLVVTNPGHPIFTTPNAIVIPPDNNLLLVSADPGGQALYVLGGTPADLVLFGSAMGDPGYAPLALEKNKYFYWGFSAPAGSLTTAGKRLIGNVLSYLLTVTAVPGEDAPGASQLGESFALSQNYPNPFNPSTTIGYSLPGRSTVTLTVFNILGQQIAQLVNGEMGPGYHEVRFDASGLASGIYLYRIQAGDLTLARRLAVMR
jgi:hypothetical protein